MAPFVARYFVNLCTRFQFHSSYFHRLMFHYHLITNLHHFLRRLFIIPQIDYVKFFQYHLSVFSINIISANSLTGTPKCFNNPINAVLVLDISFTPQNLLTAPDTDNTPIRRQTVSRLTLAYTVRGRWGVIWMPVRYVQLGRRRKYVRRTL